MPAKKAPKKDTAVSKKVVKKPVAKQARIIKSDNGARLKKLGRKQKRKQRAAKLKAAQKLKTLPTAWVVLGRSVRHLYRHKKLFLGILLVYAILYVIFIKGFSANFKLGDLRANLNSTFKGKQNSFSSGVALFGLLLGTAGTTSSETGGVYQMLLITLTSLALIWALRNTFGKYPKAGIKESFYKSTGQLVPFLGVALLMIVQLLPALIVASLYSSVQTNGLLVGYFQRGVGIAILLAGLAWTLYMLSSTMFALYIVTLPNAKPWESLRAAKDLVRFRRVLVMRKVLFLPVALLVAAAVVLLPLIIYIPIAAEVIFLVFTILILGVVHSYLYTLYRSLI
ncbi:MAG: hypothetical protein JWO47_527 [Candidatus Saccharibacteria bacterium]|nr:hypothetical protein [Candidatus Saccharibacteria bacterium]